jgi:hypothetical protein
MGKMNILKITVLISTFLFGLKEAKSQNSISLSQQQEDFKIFKTGIDEMQPGTDWFITPARFNELCDSVYKSLSDNDNIFTFANKLRFCLASLKAAHNGINLPDGVVWTKTITLPFVLRYIDEQLIIKVNCSPNQSIPSGSEIISINGKSVKEYSNEFLKYCFLNGKNTSLGYQQLGVNWEFSNLLKLLYPASNYDIEIIPFGKKEKVKVNIPIEPIDTIAKYYKIQTGRAINNWNPNAPKLEYKIVDFNKKTGYLKIATFSSGDLGKKYKKELNDIFTQIKKDKIENLIVDIRGNGGGDDDVEQYITSYFTAIPKDSSNANQYVKSDKFTLMKYVEGAGNLERDNKLFKAFLTNPYSVVDKMPDNRFKIKPELLLEDITEKPLMPNAFRGNVYLLQNGNTFSAACTFAFRLKKLIQKEGGFIKVIGEDNGYDADAGVASGGYYLNLVLPNSKIKVRIPIVASGLAKPYTIPKVNFVDYKIFPTPKECVDEIDFEMNFVKNLINKQ